MDFHFSPQPRGFSHHPFCSPSPLTCSPPFPSSSPFHTPSLSLPPSAYYYDTASYAGDSVVSSVDGGGYHVPSLPSDEHSSHPSLDMDDFSAMDDTTQHEQHGGEKEKEEEEGAVDAAASMLNFTPALQPVHAPACGVDEAPDSSESSASTSPSFPPSSALSLSGYTSSASALTHPQSTPTTPSDDVPQPHTAAAASYPPSSSIFDEPHPPSSQAPLAHSLPAPHSTTVLASFSQSPFVLPVVPLAPSSDSICSAPSLPPITGSPFPFSPPIPLSQSPSSLLVASSYVESACERVLKHRQSMEVKPSLIRQMGEEEKRAIVKTSMSRAKLPMKVRKGVMVRKERERGGKEQRSSGGGSKKRKRALDSDDSDSDSSSSDDSSDADSSDSASEQSEADVSGAGGPGLRGVRKRRAALSKKERNKMSASAYRKRKKAHIDSLHSVAHALKATVQEQSDLIDSMQKENRHMQEQLTFIQRLMAFTPHSFPQLQQLLHAKKETPQLPEGTAAAPSLTRPASPQAASAQPLSSPALPVLTTTDAQAAVALLSSEAAALPDAVMVKQEPGAANKEVVGCPAEDGGMGLTAGCSSAQRASLLLFVIFSCFLLFNPNALPPTSTTSELTFPQLTPELLLCHYQQGGAFRSNLSVDDGGLQRKDGQQQQAADGSAPSAEEAGLGAVLSFLGGRGGHVDEAFFAHVLDAVYLPLVTLVGEEPAQEAITRLARGVLFAREKKLAQVAEEPGAPSASPAVDATTATQ